MPLRTYEPEPTVFKVGFESEVGKGVHGFMKDAEAEALRAKYVHPLWKTLGKIAQTVGDTAAWISSWISGGPTAFRTACRWTWTFTTLRRRAAFAN